MNLTKSTIMKKLYVFDFHGVLEKGTENAVVEVSNLALEYMDYPQRLSKDDALKYYSLKWGEIFMNAFGFDESEAQKLYFECKRIDDSNPGIIINYTRQNDNASKVLDEIIMQKNDLILISNTRPDALKQFVKAANLEDYFNESNTFAVNKHEKGQELSKKIVLENYLAGKNYESIIIIGDSKGDVDLKNVSPYNSISILYSHEGLEFRECEADYKIRNLMDILLI